MKKGPFTRRLALAFWPTSPNLPPSLLGPWEIEILGPYFNVAVDAIGLSAQSIVHVNVLSEKINFSAQGSSNSANFGPDYLDPKY